MFGGSQGKLLLVADGLGGHESGERASTLAVDGVANYILNAMDWFFRLNNENEATCQEELKEAFQHSQNMIGAESGAIPQRRGMATTLTMAYVDWRKLYVVHVGDTRCYHVRGDSIERLTTDHTVGQLARSATGSDVLGDNVGAPVNPMDHKLRNVVGGPNESLEPQITKSELAVGDALLLCSDGLTRYVADEELAPMIAKDNCAAKEICEQFVDIANEPVGKDNITCVLAKFEESDSSNDQYEQETATLPNNLHDTAEHIKIS